MSKLRKVRIGKQNRHEKVCQVLLTGKPVSPDEIRAVFKGTDQEAVLYRLSTNIYNIRRDGGVIKVLKSGRSVSAYQLMNPQDFNADGRYTRVTKKEQTVYNREVEKLDKELEVTHEREAETVS
jgi:hypothetical protein